MDTVSEDILHESKARSPLDNRHADLVAEVLAHVESLAKMSWH
jgi:hypothetical protein